METSHLQALQESDKYVPDIISPSSSGQGLYKPEIVYDLTFGDINKTEQ